MTHEALEPCPLCNKADASVALYNLGNNAIWSVVNCKDCGCVIILKPENTRPPNPLQAENDALRARVAVLESEVEKWEQKAEMDWADQYRD